LIRLIELGGLREVKNRKRKRGENVMPRLLRIALALAALGMAIALVIAAYLALTVSTTSPPQPMSDRLFMTFVVLCPPSLLSIPIIDAEPGSGAFYALWLVIGLINAGLYGGVGGTVGYIGYLLKSRRASLQ
jgi:hypothetical protein